MKKTEPGSAFLVAPPLTSDVALHKKEREKAYDVLEKIGKNVIMKKRKAAVFHHFYNIILKNGGN